MKEKYILYVRDKNSDNTMKFEYGSKNELAVYASALIEHGYAEVRAVIEEVKETEIEGVIAQLESPKDNINQCNCNTVKKVRLVTEEDLKALSKTLNRCIDDVNDVVWTLGKINKNIVKNLEEEI